MISWRTTGFVLCLATAASCFPVFNQGDLKIYKRSTLDEIVESQEVLEGHTIEFECRASGPKPPTVYWLVDGEYLEQGPLDHIAENVIAPGSVSASSESKKTMFFSNAYTTIAKLVINRAKPADSGKYTCVANTQGEMKTKSFRAVVRGSPENHRQPSKRSDRTQEPTRIYMYTDEVYEFEGVSSLLMCRATQGASKAPPLIKWYIEDIMITDKTPGYKIRSNGDLVITRTSSNLHMAYIKCTAIGDDGSYDEKEPFVYIYEE